MVVINALRSFANFYFQSCEDRLKIIVMSKFSLIFSKPVTIDTSNLGNKCFKICNKPYCDNGRDNDTCLLFVDMYAFLRVKC